ncbi:MAG: hypothetical protein Greene071421_326 [Parcubacteria group bacterium Greene0714_21]|nr:MAG: hypothetical protein Greene041639_144 [Parcubacteria group bacterium Greene0416_39]TSC98045.1 MAG: hypothetical protein Greene101447_208 [Parcubacteria group bacterium Greene1014_47]TSD04164.1 MAG: hypothetical protein Greene071421_326 [Parcubacteria group bacterium Greene0714_21]
MNETQELRVGICACTRAFHGQLGELTVSVQELQDTILENPIIFLVRELVIPEARGHRETLHKSRCHLFLDVHEGPLGGGGVSLVRNEIIPDKRGWDSLWIGGQSIRVEKKWPVEHPPTAEEILQTIPRMLKILPEVKFQQWLGRMTPQGWELQAPIR